MNHSVKLVAEFHRTFNHPIAERPTLPTMKTVSFRKNFILEELEELEKGVHACNIEEVADGITDIQYVLDGLILNCGLQNERQITERFLKSSLYGTPRIPTISSVEFAKNYIKKELERLEHAVNENDITEVIHNISIIQMVLDSLVSDCSLEGYMYELTAEVHRSNMSKSCKDMKEVMATCELLAEDGVETNYQQVGDLYVVYRTSDGKVMKSINYSKPNLKAFLTERNLND